MEAKSRADVMANSVSTPDTKFRQRLAALHARVQDLLQNIEGEALMNRDDLAADLQAAVEELNAAEEELHQQSDELAAARSRIDSQHRRYRDLFEAAPDAYVVTDAIGIVTDANRRACELLGIEPRFLVGKPLAAFFEGGDLQCFLGVINRLKNEEGSLEVRLRVRGRRDSFDAGISVASTGHAAGDDAGLLWMIRDVTAEAAAQQALERAVAERTAELRAALSRADNASRAKDRFLAMLSHELRTPLTPALALVQNVEAQSELPEEVRQDLSVLRRNLELEARLIDDLLDLSRVTQGKLQLLRQTVDVHTLLEHVVAMCLEDAQSRQIELELSKQARDHHVHGDAARLQQIFWNVLRNALKFSDAGARVNVRSSNDESGDIVVEVTDAGIGIAPEMLPKIFGAFEQGGAPTFSRHDGGLGLGLTISRMLAELHGGRVTASSAGIGSGACFTIRLPTVPAPADGDNRGRNGSTKAEQPKPRMRRILLVEDNRDTLHALSRLLASRGYEVRTADTLAGGEALARQEPFDLLISDIGLPDGSGSDLMARMRQMGLSTRGIALSGFGMEQDVRRSMQVGFDQHLTKPVAFESLLAAIDELD